MSAAEELKTVMEPEWDRSALPPMLRQYLEEKDRHPDCLLFFQVGDFYEAFFSDAKVLASELNVTLTSRDKNSDNPIPMAGVPIAVIDSYIARLNACGISVAVVSQVGAVTGKGMVARELERIVTPGIRLLGEAADASESPVIAALYVQSSATHGDSAQGQSEVVIAFTEVQTGKIYVCTAPSVPAAEMELRRLTPTEIILPTKIGAQVIDRRLHWVRRIESIADVPLKFRALLSVSSRDVQGLKGYSNQSVVGKRAVQLLLQYVDETTVSAELPFSAIEAEKISDQVAIDATTRSNLELVKNLKDGGVEGTLYAAITRCVTVGGQRLLRRWLLAPSLNLSVIARRQDATAFLIANAALREELRSKLRYMIDFDRLASRVELAIVNPAELSCLSAALHTLPACGELLAGTPPEGLLGQIAVQLSAPQEVTKLLSEQLQDEAPSALKEGNVFKDGFDETLDSLRSLQRSSAAWILQLEANEREKTGINSLKIKFNNVHGYFIEVTKANLAKVPDHYTRKQTTAQAERYITAELKDLEEQLSTAKAKLLAREAELFSALQQAVMPYASTLRLIGENIALLDVLLSFAEYSEAFNLIRPIVEVSERLEIKNGAHPVLMQALSGRFVPNDCNFDERVRCGILTGANMGGKSTYLRQTALLVVLAQIGCFVPADSARVGLVDRIFARLGASDDILEGESTFMVEMREAANILTNATSRSLLLIDEIGRGTATSDGLAIAQAILEWIVVQLTSRTLFATHFHDLTALADQHQSVINISTASVEVEGQVIFTHEVQAGAADRSYGLEVAARAGVPPNVLKRANVLLQEQLANTPVKSTQLSMFNDVRMAQKSVADEQKEALATKVVKELRSIDIDSLSPRDALNFLYDLKGEYLAK